MHDIKEIRKDPERFANQLSKKIGASAHQSVNDILAANDLKRAKETKLQALESERNRITAQISVAVRAGKQEELADLKKAAGDLGGEIARVRDECEQSRDQFKEQMLLISNLVSDLVPEGRDESANQVIYQNKDKQTHAWSKPHWEFANRFGMNAEQGVALAGTRFTVLRGDLARLSRVLGQWMLDTILTAQNAEEVNVPLLVNRSVAVGTGQLPKFADDLFFTDHTEKSSHLLIPTAEVPLTNLLKDQVLDPNTSIRFAALSACFRKEAGGAGRDTRGLIRQHQFEKVEMVTVCTPELAAAEHLKMIASAESVLEKLGLVYRRVLLCGGDTGFSSACTYDLEVWMPGSMAWREISSISTCGDFQARRIAIKCKAGGFAHTLNGSGVAVGRALAAILEVGLQANGDVLLPLPLWQAMGVNDGLLKAKG